MKIRDIMSSRPVLVRSNERASELGSLMAAGGVHHLPVVEDGRVLGVWVATDEGPLLMLGPERIATMPPDGEAEDALAALLAGAETVVVCDAGVVQGVLTRSDVLAIVRTAVGRGVGRRHPRPVVVRLAGPAGGGKTTLLVRTLAMLGRLDVAVVQANAAEARETEIMGVRAIEEPAARQRAGLGRAVERLSDAQLILVEDCDAPVDLAHGIGEDLQVAVVDVARLSGLTPARLAGAQAVVATRADEAGGAETEEAIGALRERCPGIEVFVVAAARDDRGLVDWTRWLERQVLRRRG